MEEFLANQGLEAKKLLNEKLCFELKIESIPQLGYFIVISQVQGFPIISEFVKLI